MSQRFGSGTFVSQRIPFKIGILFNLSRFDVHLIRFLRVVHFLSFLRGYLTFIVQEAVPNLEYTFAPVFLASPPLISC